MHVSERYDIKQPTRRHSAAANVPAAVAAAVAAAAEPSALGNSRAVQLYHGIGEFAIAVPAAAATAAAAAAAQEEATSTGDFRRARAIEPHAPRCRTCTSDTSPNRINSLRRWDLYTFRRLGAGASAWRPIFNNARMWSKERCM
jgi:hypothetical protein